VIDAGNIDLASLLATIDPRVAADEFVFCTVTAKQLDALTVEPLGRFQEEEGTTLILSRGAADEASLQYDFVARRITLTVHSSLHAVGLLAAVTGRLAEQGISVNAISAYYHDHLFVPADRADDALRVLRRTSAQAHSETQQLPSSYTHGKVYEQKGIRTETMRTTIRPFADADRMAVTALWQEIFPDDRPHNAPQVAIAQKQSFQPELFYVLEVEGDLAGTIMAGYDGHRGWLYTVAVKPVYRRRGFGSELVRHAEGSLKRLGCRKINLQVRATNSNVVAFYKKLGFAIEERVSMGKLI